MACPHAATAPEPVEASPAPDKGGQVLRRELMRPQTHTSDDVNKQAMAMGGQLMMRAAAGQQVRPAAYLALTPGRTCLTMLEVSGSCRDSLGTTLGSIDK